jgi:hypothetical protein
MGNTFNFHLKNLKIFSFMCIFSPYSLLLFVFSLIPITLKYSFNYLPLKCLEQVDLFIFKPFIILFRSAAFWDGLSFLFMYFLLIIPLIY